MGYFIWGYLKWVMHVVFKVMVIVCAALLIMGVASLFLEVDLDFANTAMEPQQVIASFFQHIPRVGRLIDSVLQINERAGITGDELVNTIYEEVVFCCIYLLIVKVFEMAILAVDKICELFMTLGTINKFLVNAATYLSGYILAVMMAKEINYGILQVAPAKVVCWILVAAVFIIPILLNIFSKTGALTVFLNVALDIVMDVLQMVIICVMMMCLYTLFATETAVIGTGNAMALSAMAGALLLLLASIAVKELLHKVK